MADFPSKVTTETSSPQPQQGAGRLRGLASSATSRMDVSFLRSVPAALMAAETVLGLLHWALIAGAPYWRFSAYGWVMFVAVALWILTTLLFLVLLFSVPQRFSAVPWTMTVMMYNGVAALLYLTAFLTNAATVRWFSGPFHGHIGAAAFFGASLTLLYGAGAFLSYLDWRADGGNAATSTVPT
ncbi:plasmolipin isoform X1 [Poecilia reticulata]|uniref:Plasmolipin n=2 Tax=Poecilia reticulata TaxID=8081 RepID=A0A3P9MV77_POERE|nr:PREDICTED: plasmolipin isoform X1 [Poecilia reticulata]XP_017160576.1 PREDICTED: plasmolipin isoform X1 [Poecilia reticulata]